jgi:hypothetical protein
MIRYENHQIGDWVLVDGTPRQIQAITKKKIGYHRKENEPRLYYERLRDVEPIELTEALLCKIGFWKEPKNEKIFSCADSIDEVYAWDASCIMGKPPKIRISSHVKYVVGEGNVTLDQLVSSASCYVHAKYLHELQHAFKFCGIYFEVKL